jgi:hypothetical protein
MKTYTGATGYVYQYYFVGKRAADPASGFGPGTEFIFDITPDRKSMVATSIFLKEDALAAWSVAHGRALSETEQYAAAKLRLFQAFDEIENIREYTRLVIDASNVEALLSALGLDQ